MNNCLKLYLFIFFLFILPFNINAQNSVKKNFVIKGNLPAYTKPGKLYLALNRYGTQLTEEDTCIIKNGTFTFSGIIEEPCMAFIRVVPPEGLDMKKQAPYGGVPFDFTSFMIDFGETRIIGEDSLYNSDITGSEEQKILSELNKLIIPLEIKKTELLKFAKTISVPDTLVYNDSISRITSLWRSLENQIDSIALSFIKRYSNSYTALYLFDEYAQKKKYKHQLIEPIFESYLTPAIKRSQMGQYINKKIETDKQKLQIGQSFPGFELKDTSGVLKYSSSFKTQYLLIDFWASWCGPCRAEHPNLIALYKLFKDKGFEIVSISIDKDAIAWKKAILQDKLPWINLLEQSGWDGKVSKAYNVTYVPRNYLIGPEGKIIAIDIKIDEIKNKFSKLFAD